MQAFITADRFGHRDFGLIARSLEGTTELELVAVRGDDRPAGTIWFDDLVAEGDDITPAPPDPDTPVVVGYTSGTTADPKGVIHTHRTLNGEMCA